MAMGVHGNVRFLGFAAKIVKLVRGLGKRGSLESGGKAVWSPGSGEGRKGETRGWRQKTVWGPESGVWRKSEGVRGKAEGETEIGSDASSREVRD